MQEDGIVGPEAPPRQMGGSKVARTVGVGEDRDDRMRQLQAAEEARQEAERLRAELESVMESRSRLVRGFSHDLKNPLGAADGYLELMEEGLMGELTPKQLDSVGRVRRSIRSALALINDLAELARADSGQIAINPGPVELALVTRELVEDFRAQARTSELDIDTDLPDEAAVVVTDAERLKQVLGNLLSNAVKYTPGGGSIRVRAAADCHRPNDPQRWIMVQVEDTGPGIPEDRREEVFREFTRLDPTAAHGAGLGLAISRRLARALGGDITVSDADPRGAVFTLWLPARQAAE